MKKTFLLLFCAALTILGCGFLKIGAPAPEFSKGSWVKGKSFSLASVKGKKMTVILFWKLNHQGALSVQNFCRLAYQSHWADKASFVTVVQGPLKSVMSFPMIYQLEKIPVLIDPDKKNTSLFLRKENKLPMVAIISKEGKLLWRGAPGKAEFMINLMDKGKYDPKKVTAEDDFNAAFSGMIAKSDFKGALALLDKELDRHGTNKRELLSLQVGILYKRLNSPEKAVAAINRAQKKFPGRPDFYEMELKMLELAGLHKKQGEFYYRLINIFKNHPQILLKFVVFELNKPITQLKPDNLYTVARAAANANTYKNKKDKGRALLYYAQSLYCLGRVDIACKMVERSFKYLKGEKEYSQARDLYNYYRKLVDFSSKIKE